MVRVRRIVLIFVSILLVCYLALVGALYALQRSVLFPAPRRASQEPLREAGFRRLTPPGKPVVDVLHLPAGPGEPTLVHFHGNGEQISNLVRLGQAMRERGVGFLAVEYPGYASNPGSPSEQGFYEAAEIAIADLRASGVGPEQTVLSSRSIGGGVAVEMARRGHGARMVLLAPFTSVVDMAGLVFPFLPTRLLVRDPFDNAAKAPGIQVPVLIFHGDQDEVIPVRMGQQLGRLFPKGTMETVPGARHNDLLEQTWPVLVDRMAAFARGEPAAQSGKSSP
ncbi:alpha/beta hydrolase [Hyalangium rubrum]|uniref:Alpha/beta hydrolase n=1 Tax=Hyalangium rubrum TaxID=3103134 RepID=A0ABU5H053_9BACT|nr:alpha/beta hydrolase [Hyalangium sp. s54d21]MDY7226167.1 alpha/beta hydrolase [Hyalangium sp. s54d21]